MKSNCLLLLFVVVFLHADLKAQTAKADSAQVAKTLHDLLLICRTVDFTDPQVTKLGTFYKAAPYIVYRGDDKSRAWKVMSDYKNEYEKRGVDDICERINRTANQDSSGYKIIKYLTEKESEVLRYIALGYSNREIADKSNVSVKTVESQKAAALKKLDMQSRKDIIRYAILQGWMQEN